MKQMMLVVSLLVSTLSGQGAVSLSPLFSNHMVIQQNTSAPVWGWADPGEEVMVIASWGASSETVARADGRWQLKLKTPPGGSEPYTIRVKGKNELLIEDVLVGEVWFCGGQSNMHFKLGRLTSPPKNERYQPVADAIRKEIQQADDPQLRMIEVPEIASPFKERDCFVGEWVKAVRGNVEGFSATAYYFAREIRVKTGLPVGLIDCNWGGTRVQPWIPAEAYQSDSGLKRLYDDEIGAFKKALKSWDPVIAEKRLAAKRAAWEKNGRKGTEPQLQPPESNKQLPATLYNGMVSVVKPYAIRGVIWYQGESNANPKDSSTYARDFSALVTSWRKCWGQGDFPFYYAQLAAFRQPVEEPVDVDHWASICDQQRRALALPNSGMAVLNDIGEARDIHPHNKMDVGRRLSLWALANEYGVEVPEVSGPLYLSHTIQGNHVLIRFTHAGSGLTAATKNLMEPAEPTNDPLRHFQICGTDRVWKWADAVIVDHDTIKVSHVAIVDPVAVRYAWASNPASANLYNKEGLPASVFTTE